jgi:polyferredoxin
MKPSELMVINTHKESFLFIKIWLELKNSLFRTSILWKTFTNVIIKPLSPWFCNFSLPVTVIKNAWMTPIHGAILIKGLLFVDSSIKIASNL